MNFVRSDKRLDAAVPTAAPLPEATTQDPSAAESPPRRWNWAWLGTAASLVLFCVSLVVLYKIVATVSWADLRAAFTAASTEQIGFAVGLTAVSYLSLTGYDALALRQLHLKVPYRTTALASFTSYAVSFNLGFPLLTAGTVRYWIYAPKGLGAKKIAALTVIAGFTFWLGMGAVLGYSLMREAGPLSLIAYTTIKLNQGLGLAVVLAVAAYLAWVSIKRPSVRVQGWRLELPGLRVSVGQMIVGAIDVCAAAGVLYVLLPAGHGLGYETFLAVYVLAAMLGIASHAPGGLGVFEATILVALSSLPRESVLGALLLFRVLYYFVPFVIALACLGAYEIAKRIRLARREMAPGQDD